MVKWLSVRLRTKWLWVRVPLQSLALLSRLSYHLPQNSVSCVSATRVGFAVPTGGKIPQNVKDMAKIWSNLSNGGVSGCFTYVQ